MQRASNTDWMNHIRDFVTIARERGIRIQIGSDFHEFKRLAQRHTEKNGVNPAFDPQFDPPGIDNAIWITGHAEDGSLVHMQAMKCLDLTGSTLQGHLRRNLDDFRTGGYSLNTDASRWYLTEAAANISGLVTYHGELWIKGGPGGYRGGCLVVVLTRLMMVIGMLKWDPDFMIGLQSPMTSCRGLACREGYAHIEQRSILWDRKDGRPPLEDWLVWMSREEARFNLRLPPEFLVELFEGQAAEPMMKKAAAG